MTNNLQHINLLKTEFKSKLFIDFKTIYKPMLKKVQITYSSGIIFTDIYPMQCLRTTEGRQFLNVVCVIGT